MDSILSSDDPASTKQPTLFPDFDWQSTYVLEMNPAGELFCEVAFLIPEKKHLNNTLPPSGLTNSQLSPCMRLLQNIWMESEITK